MIFLYLSVASCIAWFISTLAGGGSPIILVPLVAFLFPAPAIAPVITTAMLMGNSQRLCWFWDEIDWQVTHWYWSGAVPGAILGAYIFTQINLEWLQLAIGSFLLLCVISSRFGTVERTFQVPAWYFLPGGFFQAFISGLIGSSGPMLNPFYLNYGLLKKQMIATKSLNVVGIHLIKIATYLACGAFKLEDLGYGVLLGLAAIPGNWIGQYVISKMNEKTFRQIVVVLMAMSGLLMMWQQRQLIDFTFW